MTQAAAPQAPPPPAPARSKGRLRLLLIVAAALVGLLVLAGVLLYVFWIPHLVVQEAKKRGVELELGEVSVSWGHATLESSRFRLEGVTGLQGEVDHVEVTLDGFEPRAFEARGLKLQVVGSAPTLALELSQWTAKHRSAYQKTVRVSGIDVTWKSSAEAKPWLQLSGGAIVPIEQGAAFNAANVDVGGLKVGKVGAAWTADSASVSFGFGDADTKSAPVRVRVHDIQPGGTSAKVRVDVSPITLEKLAGPLAAPLPVEKSTQVKGFIQFDVKQAAAKNGKLELTLIDYKPPTPRELDAFVFGDDTSFSTDFEMTDDRKQVRMTNSKVAVGAFKLAGDGTIDRLDDHARVKLKLIGNLPCTELAKAAAVSHLGKGLGGLIGGIARRHLKGSVGVTIAIDADTRKLQDAKVAKLIGIGCGLKPLELPNLNDFPELNELPGFEELKKQLPKLPPPPGSGALPSLPVPSGMPQLPPPPKFPFPLGNKKQAAPAD